LRFGQPSRGLTIRRRVRAKLPIARAAMPIFSPSCGSTRMTTGPARSKPVLVLSVPAPVISFYFPIRYQCVESACEPTDSELFRRTLFRLPVRRKFLKRNNGLDSTFDSGQKPRAERRRGGRCLAHEEAGCS